MFFNGDQAMLARANINSRFAERILIVLDRFTAVTFEELFQAVRRLPWSEFIGSTDTFPVKGTLFPPPCTVCRIAKKSLKKLW